MAGDHGMILYQAKLFTKNKNYPSLFCTFCLDTKSTQKVKAEGCFHALACAPPRPSAIPSLVEF
jgi:hypothetical protein